MGDWGGRCTQGQRPFYYNFRGQPRHLTNERTIPRTLEEKQKEDTECLEDDKKEL